MKTIINYSEETVNKIHELSKEFLEDINRQKEELDRKDAERRDREKLIKSILHKRNGPVYKELEELDLAEIKKIKEKSRFKKFATTHKNIDYKTLLMYDPNGGCGVNWIDLKIEFGSKEYLNKKDEIIGKLVSYTEIERELNEKGR